MSNQNDRKRGIPAVALYMIFGLVGIALIVTWMVVHMLVVWWLGGRK